MNYQYYNPNLMQMQPVQMPQQSFVVVRSEEEARNYPVAQGNSILFRDETSPYVYTKTMGFSQLDRPTFEKYRLIKEGEVEEPKYEAQITSIVGEITALNEAVKGIGDEIKAMQEQHEALKKKVNRPKKQIIQEVDDDE